MSNVIEYLECSKLKSISVPLSIKYFNDYCFYNCYNLENITFEEKSNLIKIGNSAFYKCYKLKSISIPSSVSEIENEVFYKCYNLFYINLLVNLRTIGSYSFYGCYKLKSISIPSSIEFKFNNNWK